ncbi:alpha-amylase/4-alpha-glucanotransferase domain-containing protein [Spirochaeta dissipatitropha]
MKNKLIFGTYNSLPVGTSDDVLEEHYQSAYKPFIQQLYTHREIHAVVYYCGILLDWLAANHSEFINVLSEMVSRRQIEIIGGGFYEPIFTMIPRQDRVGQIELMTTMIRKQFGRRPRGCWIPECVWEQGLTSSLCSSGMEYTFLEESQFALSGLRGDSLYRPAITEDQGKTVIVFPLHSAGKTAFLPDRSLFSGLDKQERLFVRFVPGETIGLEGLNDVVNAVEAGQIQSILPSRYLRTNIRRQRIYFPSSSCEAMQHWAHDIQPQRERQQAEQVLQENDLQNVSLSGGFFRNFLTRYPEVSRLYAKMQYTHIVVNQIRGDKQRKQAAREELWRGQHHSAYWHGRGAGVYDAAIRSELYRSLIQAEKMARERGIFKPSIISLDFDMDGSDEYLYQGVGLNAYVHSLGGSLFELDSLDTQQNYINTMSRHPEEYHKEDAVAYGYDAYSRTAFLDHFVDPAVNHEDFESGNTDKCSRFHDKAYEMQELNRDQFQISFLMDGPLYPGSDHRVEIGKQYSFTKDSVQVSYSLHNCGDRSFSTVFMPEINLSFPDLSTACLRVLGRDSRESEDISPERRFSGRYTQVQFIHQPLQQNVILDFDEPCEIWGNPMKTMCRQNGGEIAFFQQGCTVLPRWIIEIQPGEKWKTSVRLQLKKSKRSGATDK